MSMSACINAAFILNTLQVVLVEISTFIIMMFFLSDTSYNSSSLEINNSEFWRGVGTIDPEQPFGLTGGLVIVAGVFNHDIHITINNTVIAENSGILAGNLAINIVFGTEHVTVRLEDVTFSQVM